MTKQLAPNLVSLEASEHFDVSVIEKLYESYPDLGSTKFAVEIVEMFLSCLSERIEKIETAIQKQDLVQAARAAHALKSSSRAVGATHMSLITEKLEKAASEKNLEEVSAQSKRLAVAKERLKPHMAAYLALRRV